ncbi:GNAT family N-acetyltransferase [Knoellia subterranea]|uniref:GNAT family N-acetyltransferase n=1 Tax=Knoellia subterranea TaxID=184882 RepID=UPI00056B6975|nr:GNAT family N-acetyltransferase [Knoellia subterranea]
MPTPFDAVHIGARVVVRSRLAPAGEAPHDGPSMTDTVGTLVARDATRVVVATRHGDVSIHLDRIVAAKEIPPRPSRRGAAHLAPTVSDLQRISGPSWGALEREHLGDWELRASAGYTQRGNSVLPGGDPGIPLTDAVDAIERWYAVRGLPARVQLGGPIGFDPAGDPLGAELLRRNWSVGSLTLCLTAPTERIASADPGGADVIVSADAGPEWLEAHATTRSGAGTPAAVAVITGSPRHLFGQIRPGGGLSQKLGLRDADAAGTTPIALARLGIAHGWAGLGAVWTHPAYRGRGHAAHLTARLAAAAREDGIHLMHLQVEADNATALALYERLGFDQHSSYVYLTAPGGN